MAWSRSAAQRAAFAGRERAAGCDVRIPVTSARTRGDRGADGRTRTDNRLFTRSARTVQDRRSERDIAPSAAVVHRNLAALLSGLLSTESVAAADSSSARGPSVRRRSPAECETVRACAPLDVGFEAIVKPVGRQASGWIQCPAAGSRGPDLVRSAEPEHQ